MLFRDCTDGVLRPLLVPLALTLVAGCAGTGGNEPVAEPSAAEVAEPAPEIRAQHAEAVSLLVAGDLTAAETLLDEFVAAHPAYPGAWTNLAIVYRMSDRPEAAAAALATALELAPDHAPALNQLGILHRQAGRFARAEAAYMKAVTARPDYALAHFNLGVLNDLYLGSPETALGHYERYQTLSGENDETVAMWIADLRRRLGLEIRSARADR